MLPVFHLSAENKTKAYMSQSLHKNNEHVDDAIMEDPEHVGSIAAIAHVEHVEHVEHERFERVEQHDARKEPSDVYYSINTRLVGKVGSEILARSHAAWVKKRGTLTELISDLTAPDRGYAIAPVLSGRRSSKNFASIQVLCADIDYGQSFSAVANTEWVRRNVAFMYTTASHTEEENRFRVVAVLKTPLSDPVLAKHAINGMIVMFSGDEACKDIARLYFGHPGAIVERFDNELSDDALVRLILLGKERRALEVARSFNPMAGGAQRSRLMLPSGIHVWTEQGEYARLRDVAKGARLLCPVHADRNSSAFRIHSERVGIYCSKCSLSFYVEGEQALADDSWFDYDWTRARTFTEDEKLDNVDADPSFAEIEATRGLKIVHQRYLPYDELQLTPRMVAPFPEPFEHEVAYRRLPNANSDILMIKSAKGSGKTEWLESYIPELKANGYSVLVISHRRSLIQVLCKRLGLNSYIDARGNWQEPSRHFAVCLDSLHKMSTEAHKYDIVIIDECEQVISHCLSATFRGNRRPVLLKLQHYLGRSMRMVLLDADLSKLTVTTIADMFPSKAQQTYINDWKPVGTTLHIVREKLPQQIVGELVAAINRGERVFVCSNSKTDIDLLATQLPLFCERPELRCISVTSDDSQDAKTQAFVSNIATEILDYDVVLASPSISTGVDITFPKDAQHVDLVIGIFRPLVTTHLEIDQQLLRVRHPKKTMVWVASDQFAFDTDPGVIRAEIEASEAEHRVLQAIEPTGKETYLKNEMYERIYANVTAMQRASKNDLRELFIDYRMQQGSEIVVVPHDAALARLGARVMMNGRSEREERRAQEIVDAAVLTSLDYAQLRRLEDRGDLAKSERLALQRYRIEDFYGQEASEELIKYDNKGAMRTYITNLMSLLASQEDVKVWDELGSGNLRPDQFQYRYRRKLLSDLLAAASLLREGGLDTGVPIHAGGLANFLAAFQENVVALQRVFGIAPRADMSKNPVAQLKAVLKVVGVNMKKVRRDQSGKTDNVIYALDAQSYEVVRQYALRRMQQKRDTPVL